MRSLRTSVPGSKGAASEGSIAVSVVDAEGNWTSSQSVAALVAALTASGRRASSCATARRFMRRIGAASPRSADTTAAGYSDCDRNWSSPLLRV